MCPYKRYAASWISCAQHVSGVREKAPKQRITYRIGVPLLEARITYARNKHIVLGPNFDVRFRPKYYTEAISAIEWVNVVDLDEPRGTRSACSYPSDDFG